MVAKPVLVMYCSLSQQTPKLFLRKMTSIITNKGLGDSIARKDHLLEEPNYNSGVIGGVSEGLHPLRDVIDGHQDVLVVPGRWQRSHEVHALSIKDFNLKYIV